MASLKNHEVDRWITKPDPRYRLLLVYGPDTGLVSERADRIAEKTGVDLGDPFSAIRLNADDVAEDKSRLLDEAFTVGMFGGERLIRISGSTRRNLLDAVKPVLDQLLQDVWILIEAGDLKPKTGLRGAVEKSAAAMAIPCYQDDNQMLAQLVREELTDKGFTIDRDLVDYLLPFLGGDRLASRNELQKLALYAHGETTITREHITAIVGDASTVDINDVIDAVAMGDMARFEANFERVLSEGISPDMLILQTMRHFQLLHEMRGKMESGRTSASAVVEGARPPIFYKRRAAVAKCVSKLKIGTIEKILNRLETAAFDARSKPELAKSVAGTSLLAALLQTRS